MACLQMRLYSWRSRAAVRRAQVRAGWVKPGPCLKLSLGCGWA